MLSWTFIAREEKSMPNFKVSKFRLILLSARTDTASDFQLKIMLICHSENPRALKNDTKSTLLVLYK